MSLEALWSIEFWALPHKPDPVPADVTAQGAGVVVLETSRVFGGDTSYMYVGDYEVQNKKVTARVKVSRYSPYVPRSVFGPLDEFEVTLTGDVNDSEMWLMGQSPQATGQWLATRLIRRAELP